MRPRDEAVKQTTLFDVDDPETSEKGPQGVKIEFKDVFFKYPTRDVPVLNGLNMTVRTFRDHCLFRMLTTFDRSKRGSLLPLSALLVVVRRVLSHS